MPNAFDTLKPGIVGYYYISVNTEWASGNEWCLGGSGTGSDGRARIQVDPIGTRTVTPRTAYLSATETGPPA